MLARAIVIGMLPIPDVPDGSAAWLAWLLRRLDDAPPWMGGAIDIAGEVALLLVGVVWCLLHRRARGADTGAVATALAVPVACVLTWPGAEAAKLLMRVDRPCRLLDGFPAWASCPAPGDWSFPSNHAALAGALASGVLLLAHRLAAPRAALLAGLAAGTVAASRVLAGAHFPHDVLAGLALGGIVSLVTVTSSGSCAASVVERLRARGCAPLLLGGSVRPCRAVEAGRRGRRR